METIKNQQGFNKPKNQSVEGEKIYKTRKYVQSTRTRLTAEARRKRDQYLIEHKEEILKYDDKDRVKKVAELLKQELNLDVNYKTLRSLISKYVIKGIINQNTEARRKRDQYLIDHKEEILKYDDKDRIKKVQEMLKQDLNLDVNYKTIYPIINKYVLADVKNENADARKLRDQYLKDHMEEILKLDHWNKVKQVQELLKKDLNLYVNYNKLYLALTKFDLL